MAYFQCHIFGGVCLCIFLQNQHGCGAWEERPHYFNKHTQKLWEAGVCVYLWEDEQNGSAYFFSIAFCMLNGCRVERKCSINLTCGNNRFDINIRLSIRTAHTHGILYVSLALIDIESSWVTMMVIEGVKTLAQTKSNESIKEFLNSNLVRQSEIDIIRESFVSYCRNAAPDPKMYMYLPGPSMCRAASTHVKNCLSNQLKLRLLLTGWKVNYHQTN